MFQAIRGFHKSHKSMDELNNNSNITADTLFGAAAKMIHLAKILKLETVDKDDIEEEAEALLDSILETPVRLPSYLSTYLHIQLSISSSFSIVFFLTI